MGKTTEAEDMAGYRGEVTLASANICIVLASMHQISPVGQLFVGGPAGGRCTSRLLGSLPIGVYMMAPLGLAIRNSTMPVFTLAFASKSKPVFKIFQSYCQGNTDPAQSSRFGA